MRRPVNEEYMAREHSPSPLQLIGAFCLRAVWSSLEPHDTGRATFCICFPVALLGQVTKTEDSECSDPVHPPLSASHTKSWGFTNRDSGELQVSESSSEEVSLSGSFPQSWVSPAKASPEGQ